MPESAATWFPLQTATSLMGVLGLQFHREQRLDFATRQMIEAFALQLALVLEKEHFIQAVSRAEVLASSRKLHRTLLDSISHELKTPIAVINASVEGMSGTPGPYLAEITTASQRLQRVVDHLLHMTQLESGCCSPTRLVRPPRRDQRRTTGRRQAFGRAPGAGDHRRRFSTREARSRPADSSPSQHPAQRRDLHAGEARRLR
ncbi:MAG: histidine kinase dimerization/phospho-acceptor domain-containing protein [Verrucomicrobiaceae bacterium]